jgi:quercetin dioxygenase-like cupin family protein
MKTALKYILLFLIISCTFLLSEAKEPQGQIIYKAGANDPYDPALLKAHFTGNVVVVPLFPANDTLNYGGATVTFEPCVRSDWHTHPAGQLIMITAGEGLTQVWDEPVTKVHPGDIIWCPAGVKHWHGAASNSSMTHTVLTGVKDGNNVVRLEKVSNEQYCEKE